MTALNELEIELRRIIREELQAAIGESEVLNTDQVAALLKCHPRTVTRFWKEKGLPAAHLPGTKEVRFLRKQVIEWAFSNGKLSAA